MVIPMALYYWTLGQNVSDAEKKHNKDMTYELNPFTGEKMPVDSKKKIRKKKHRIRFTEFGVFFFL